jgi:hypothetical protein
VKRVKTIGVLTSISQHRDRAAERKHEELPFNSRQRFDSFSLLLNVQTDVAVHPFSYSLDIWNRFFTAK